MASAIIFDFDGVIADSEVLANTVFAEIRDGIGSANNSRGFHTATTWASDSTKWLPRLRKRLAARYPNYLENCGRSGPWHGSGKILYQLRVCGSSSQNSQLCPAASHRPPRHNGSQSRLRFWK